MLPSTLLPSARQVLTLQRKTSVGEIATLMFLIGCDTIYAISGNHRHHGETKFWFEFGGLTLLVGFLAFTLVDRVVHPVKYVLTLAPEGFSVGSLRGRNTWKWNDVAHFRVLRSSGFVRQIVFNFVDGGGGEDSLLGAYSPLGLKDLAELLNCWREHYQTKSR